MPSPSWLPSAIIYQIFTGRWEAEISGDQIIKQDTFQSFKNRDWQRLKDLGINTLYFLGIWDNHGPIIVHEEEGVDLFGKQPRIPSVFAIIDHTAFHPDLGNNEDFQALLNHLHSLDFKVIVDFVPNHTSTVHPWVTDHPEYYHLNLSQESDVRNQMFITEFSGDVYKLNYQNPELRDRMLQIIQHIFSHGVDGIRCDMAHLIPNDFWSAAITNIKATYQEAAFIAESYPYSPFDYSRIHGLLNAGFDAVYNKDLYDTLIEVMVNHQPLIWLSSHLNALKNNFNPIIHNSSFIIPAINFFSNHDEPPPAISSSSQRSNVNDQLSNSYLEALLSVILFIPGIPFIYNGNLLGLDHRLAHHWFEPLPSQYIETGNQLPDNILKLFQLRQQRHPHGISSEHFYTEATENQLILKNQDHKGQEYQLPINFFN